MQIKRNKKDMQELKNIDALSRYLSDLQAEEIFTAYENDITDGGVSGTFADPDKFFALTENYFNVMDEETGQNKQFYIRTPIDWKYIDALK